MPRRLSDKQAIRLALYYAIEWERSFVGSYTEPRQRMPKEWNDANPFDPQTQETLDKARANIRAFRRVLDRYFGGQPEMPKGKVITLQELFRRIDEDHAASAAQVEDVPGDK